MGPILPDLADGFSVNFSLLFRSANRDFSAFQVVVEKKFAHVDV